MRALFQLPIRPQFDPAIEVQSIRWPFKPYYPVRLQQIAGSDIKGIKDASVVYIGRNALNCGRATIVGYVEDLRLFIACEQVDRNIRVRGQEEAASVLDSNVAKIQEQTPLKGGMQI